VEFAFLLISTSIQKWRLLLAGIVGALTLLPWVLVLMSQSALGEISKKVAWNARPSLADFGFYCIGTFGWLLTSGSSRYLLLMLVIAVLPFLWRWRNIGWQESLPSALAVAPPVLLFLVARYGPGSIWAPRHMIGSAIFMIMSIGFGLTHHSRRWLGFGVSLALLLWCVLAVNGAFPGETRIPWRNIVDSLNRDCPNCTIVGQEGWCIIPLRFYSGRDV